MHEIICLFHKKYFSTMRTLIVKFIFWDDIFLGGKEKSGGSINFWKIFTCLDSVQYNYWNNLNRINIFSVQEKSPAEICKKWRNLLSQAKEMEAEFQRDRSKTGSGPAPTPVNTRDLSQKVLEWCPLDFSWILANKIVPSIKQ